VIGQIVPGGPLEVAFGYMAEPSSTADYPTARLRVLNANGLGLVADAPIPDWKSSPSIGDLLPGTPGLEIAGGRYRGVYAARVTPAGKIVTIWNHDIGTGNFGYGGNRSSPAIADINGDGTLDVLIGIEGETDTGLNAYDGPTGALLWHFAVDAPGVDGSPSVGDIDGDGRLEVLFFGIDGKIYALDRKDAVP
jgi:outer membrane protein assembly factor BamB